MGTFLIWLGMSLSAAATTHELRLYESLVLPLHGTTEVVVNRPDVLDYQKIEQDQLVITGKQVGEAEVLFFAKGVLQQRAMVRILPKLEPRLRLSLSNLQRRLPELKAETQENGIIVLSGSIAARHRAEVTALLEAFPRLVSQLDWQPEAAPTMLVLELYIAEVKRSYARRFGVRWPTAINGPLLENASDWFHLPFSAQATLDTLEREGHAQVLAAPKLSAINGGNAQFLVGGEFPIPQVSLHGLQDITFRPYGVQLEIAPQLLADGKVQASLSAELSSIDPATSVNGVPGLLARKVASTFVLPLGETLVLSGLIQHEQSSQTDRFPELHALPILGALFRSTQFQNAETDLVIMVTPRLAVSEAEAQQTSERLQHDVKLFHRAVGCSGLYDPVWQE
ncbi:hypothetical protein CWI80_11935 [Pseudidiomarina sediminum]|uniref:Uncharacterized protein n=1 Tax=Pseudidiomarina sediminum TaxID=431675 RepID=A0A432YZM9_9GAMM|nr:pilus assembly protein N-terminal domain-containing protein [Pseudidiomarina sediminum]MBY6065074.1 pilus assembly protein N-terminal domain-containing protein [Pseudidiomarina sediminum]RUO69347.1 hypothetical protein CWI80_11935 [Pseudidiomarina sediminum]